VTVRFLADEDLDADIVDGLCFREPAIDILDVKTAGLRGTKDPLLLELAVAQDRILITHDRNTMTRYFRDRMAAGKPNPGVFILPQQESAIGGIIEWLLLVWTVSEAEEWRDQIFYVRPG
jgi:predicted nuclease of predicted toxin-antitoxin system